MGWRYATPERPEDAGPLLDVTLGVRMTRDMRAQIEEACCDVGMSAPEWSRAVFKSALELHARNMAEERAATGQADPDDEPEPEPEPMAHDPGYAEAVEQAAAEARADALAAARAERAAARQAPPKLSPRECPHLPHWRSGGRCRCGATIGGRVSRSRGR